MLSGHEVAEAVKAEVSERVGRLASKSRQVGLATVLVGDDPASHSYVRNKRKTASTLGINSIHHQLKRNTSQDELFELIDRLNSDDSVDAILVQFPLPDHLDEFSVQRRIDPGKDADGLHPRNLGLIVSNQPFLVPCTPQGVIRILEHYGIETAGRRAVVVGRSLLVGRPLALLMSAKGVDATVTTAHSRTLDLASVTREADIVAAAVGVPHLITAAHIKPGAVVVDVGITRDEGRLKGDVDFEAVAEVAAAVTPVPGGVGPMTVAMLMRNAVISAEHHAGIGRMSKHDRSRSL